MNKFVYFLLLSGLSTGLLPVIAQETCSVCIRVEGHLKLNENIRLKCNINQFNTGKVSWVTNGNKTESECLFGLYCLNESSENKYFSINDAGSVLEFRPLLKKDLGITWECIYQEYRDSFTIAIASDQTNDGTSDIFYKLPLVAIFGCLIHVILTF